MIHGSGLLLTAIGEAIWGNVQGDANGISGRGCTGACNAVNTTLTTEAQLQQRSSRVAFRSIRTYRGGEKKA